jgi:hypothetical protein
MFKICQSRYSTILTHFQVNCPQLSPSGAVQGQGHNFPVIGDLSRPSSANGTNCDDESNVCGCAENAKQSAASLNGDRSRHIETSTDTLVADGDVEERLRARCQMLLKIFVVTDGVTK